jgi:methylase of polypeptide subunit release factors
MLMRCPFSELNVACRDYFSFEVKEEEKFDAIVGNPPYTRWVEIPDETQELIKEKVGDLAKNYDLVVNLKRGQELASTFTGFSTLPRTSSKTAEDWE